MTFLCQLIYNYVRSLTKYLNKMKEIVFRSLGIATILALICIGIDLACFVEGLLAILPCVFLFFLYRFDSRLVWKLKRIKPWMTSYLVWGYLIVAVISMIVCYCSMKLYKGMVLENPYALTVVVFSVMSMILSFRYFIILVKNMTIDWELSKLAIESNR